MMRLAVLGASGHGRVVADAAEASGWSSVEFFDDVWPDIKTNGAWPVIGNSHTLLDVLTEFNGVVIAIGNNAIRESKQREVLAAGAKLASIVHPSAVISSRASLGNGTVVFANAVINGFAVVGEGVIINTGAIVEHDCQIGAFAHVSPNAVLAGGVTLGRRVWVGANASIRQLVSIGEAAIVGMGAVVTKDVPANVTVVGNPAKANHSSALSNSANRNPK